MPEQRTVHMPALTASMEAAELVAWTIGPGDTVEEGDPIADVVTDKVDMELEAPHAGRITELLVEPGSEVEVGTPIARMASEEADLLGGLGLDDEPAASGPDSSGGSGQGGSETADAARRQGLGTAIIPAPPPVRKRARELGIPLEEVEATGSRGQVTRQDLRRYREQQGGDREPVGSRAPDDERRTAASGTDRPVADETRRRAAIRRATAQATTRAQRVPQFTLFRRIDLTRAERRRGGRSWTTEITRALAGALWRHARLNARWDDQAERPERLDEVRIGLAVDTPDGLVVVGVDDPDGRSPEEADEAVAAAVQRARDGGLRPDDRRGLSSTVSNLGGLGVDRFEALVMPPQASILSVGRVVERPAVVDGRVRPRLQVEVGLTVDHRVADGADAAEFLETFSARIAQA